MPNKNYIKGVRRERALVNKARAEGKIAARSAGSHSPIDLFIIDTAARKIEFIQVKDFKVCGKEKQALEDLQRFSDEYFVEFKVWTAKDKIDKRKKEFRE